MLFIEYYSESKKQNGIWVQNGSKRMACLPSSNMTADQEPCHHETVSHTEHSPGRAGSSKSEVWFLLNAHLFNTVMKSKNTRSKHHESGTVCI